MKALAEYGVSQIINPGRGCITLGEPSLVIRLSERAMLVRYVVGCTDSPPISADTKSCFKSCNPAHTHQCGEASIEEARCPHRSRYPCSSWLRLVRVFATPISEWKRSTSLAHSCSPTPVPENSLSGSLNPGTRVVGH